MKNKVFVRVPVSERLPTSFGWKLTLLESKNTTISWFDEDGFDGSDVTHWLEEREDRTAELVEMLKSVIELQSDHCGNFSRTHLALILKAKEIQQLITSIEKGESNG